MGLSPLKRRERSAAPAMRNVLACAALLVLGGTEAVLASQWQHTFGVAVGAATCASALLYLVPLLLPAAADGTPGGVALRRTTVHVTRTVGGLCLLLRLVRLASPEPPSYEAFPNACPSWLPDGCARATLLAPHGLSPPLPPLTLRSSRAAVAAAVAAWARSADAPTRGARLRDSRPPELLHLRFVSRFWGFADDVLVSITSCNAGAAADDEHALTVVQAHSQLRLGRGDLGVNAARTRALWAHLAATQPAGPRGGCRGEDAGARAAAA